MYLCSPFLSFYFFRPEYTSADTHLKGLGHEIDFKKFDKNRKMGVGGSRQVFNVYGLKQKDRNSLWLMKKVR